VGDQGTQENNCTEEEVTGGWRKLHNDELHNLHALPNISGIIKSKRIRWVGNVTRMGDTRYTYNILVGKYEWSRPLGRPRRRWEASIIIYLTETGCEIVGWIHLSQDRGQWQALVNKVTKLRVP
jgi:hypothetical protein